VPPTDLRFGITSRRHPGNIQPDMPIEYEIKLPGERHRLIQALESIGACPAGPRTLEDDLVLDTPEQKVFRSGGLLRLRRRGDDFLLTLKGPSDEDGVVKARTEVETRVMDGAATLDLFEQLGFQVALRYQKYRTHYDCPVAGCDALAVSLDETPIGDYVEIEGPPEQIHRCAAALGFDKDAYETRSYLELHRDHGNSGDMVFDGPEAAPWRAGDETSGLPGTTVAP